MNRIVESGVRIETFHIVCKFCSDVREVGKRERGMGCT